MTPAHMIRSLLEGMANVFHAGYGLIQNAIGKPLTHLSCAVNGLRENAILASCVERRQCFVLRLRLSNRVAIIAKRRSVVPSGANDMQARIHDRGRGPEIEGARITVYDVFEYLQSGWHATAIAGLFRLSSQQVQAAMDYIDGHRADVEADFQEIMARIQKGNPPELLEKFRASRDRLQQKLAEIQQREPEGAGHLGGQ